MELAEETGAGDADAGAEWAIGAYGSFLPAPDRQGNHIVARRRASDAHEGEENGAQGRKALFSQDQTLPKKLDRMDIREDPLLSAPSV